MKTVIGNKLFTNKNRIKTRHSNSKNVKELINFCFFLCDEDEDNAKKGGGKTANVENITLLIFSAIALKCKMKTIN